MNFIRHFILQSSRRSATASPLQKSNGLGKHRLSLNMVATPTTAIVEQHCNYCYCYYYRAKRSFTTLARISELLLQFLLLISAASCTTKMASTDTTVHSAGISEVYDVPMEVIKRPIPSVLDEKKVQSLMETIKVRSNSFHYHFYTFSFAYRCVVYFSHRGRRANRMCHLLISCG